MGVPSCKEIAGSGVHMYNWDRCNPILFLHLSSSAPMLQRHVAHHSSWNSTTALLSQSLYLLTCTPPPNHTFLIQYQPTTKKETKDLHPCNYEV
ncbi:hypothetical protein GQ457_17G010410 [Hibiscus cannabinus]